MSRRRIALLVVVGLLALTNGLWLFPHEGERVYTYERVEVTIEEGPDGPMLAHEDAEAPWLNDIEGLACQVGSTNGWRCGFDRYLAKNGPVSVSRGNTYPDGGGPDYTEVSGDYYERVVNETESGVSYDVRRVDPATVRRAVATDYRGVDASDVGLLTTEIAITGERVTTRTELDDGDLGQVYRLDDGYYAVIQTDTRVLDRPFLEPGIRAFAGFFGGCLLFVAFGLAIGDERGGDA